MLEMYLIMTVCLAGIFGLFFVLVLMMIGLDGEADAKQRDDAKALGAVTLLSPLWPLFFIFLLYLVVRGIISLFRSENA